MGQLTPRRNEDEEASHVAASGQRLWLESCSVCGQPMTVVALTRPTEPRCARCAAASATDG